MVDDFDALDEEREWIVSFRIVGDELDPDEVTKTLGIDPHTVRKKGEHPQGNKRFRSYPYSGWSIDSILPRTAPLQDHLSSILDLLDGVETVVANYAQENDVRFVCSAYGGGSIALNHALLVRITHIKASLILNGSP